MLVIPFVLASKDSSQLGQSHRSKFSYQLSSPTPFALLLSLKNLKTNWLTFKTSLFLFNYPPLIQSTSQRRYFHYIWYTSKQKLISLNSCWSGWIGQCLVYISSMLWSSNRLKTKNYGWSIWLQEIRSNASAKAYLASSQVHKMLFYSSLLPAEVNAHIMSLRVFMNGVIFSSVTVRLGTQMSIL